MTEQFYSNDYALVYVVKVNNTLHRNEREKGGELYTFILEKGKCDDGGSRKCLMSENETAYRNLRTPERRLQTGETKALVSVREM